MRYAWTAIVLCAVLAGLACAARSGGGSSWTERQAESISTVRGLAVHVRRCTGLGRGRALDGVIAYGRFACLAGARLAHEPIDTVAVTYVLRPLGDYRGASSRYVLTNVHFGGLGVP